MTSARDTLAVGQVWSGPGSRTIEITDVDTVATRASGRWVRYDIASGGSYLRSGSGPVDAITDMLASGGFRLLEAA